MILALPALYFLFLLFLSFINKPVIKDINVPDMTNFEFKSNQNDMSDNYNQVESSLTFDYELIEVSKDEVVFRKDEKLYKIENLVGTSL